MVCLKLPCSISTSIQVRCQWARPLGKNKGHELCGVGVKHLEQSMSDLSQNKIMIKLYLDTVKWIFSSLWLSLEWYFSLCVFCPQSINGWVPRQVPFLFHLLLNWSMWSLFGSIMSKKWLHEWCAILSQYPPVVTDLRVFLKNLSAEHLIFGCETPDPWSHLFHYQQVQASPVHTLHEQNIPPINQRSAIIKSLKTS